MFAFAYRLFYEDFSPIKSELYMQIHQCDIFFPLRFFVQVKVENKAHLSSSEGIGSVVIDFTPPVYQGGMQLVVDDFLTLTWNATSFYDDEDTAVLTDYQWALGNFLPFHILSISFIKMYSYTVLNILFPIGTASNPQEVQSWTPLLVPVQNITSDFAFTVTYELSHLQAHDQERGRTYNFFIKSFNRAGLASMAQSPEYQVFSNIPPTVGGIYHISENNSEEISFQAQDDVLCSYWTGFTHHDGQLNMSLSIGSYPGGNNILPGISVASDGKQCFRGLVLPHLHQSFVNILAFNEKGSVNSSSKGIFIASEDEILHLAKVNDGPDCTGEFIELDTDVKLGNNEPNTKNFSLSTMPSVTYVTLSVQYEWPGDFRPCSVSRHWGRQQIATHGCFSKIMYMNISSCPSQKQISL